METRYNMPLFYSSISELRVKQKSKIVKKKETMDLK
jgi:hypothetical protein